MSYSLIDVIPWSLIYGAQNEKHLQEVKELEEKLLDYQNIIDKNIEFLLDSLFNTTDNEFHYNNHSKHSDIWVMFFNQKKFITPDKIDKACQKFLSNNDKNWWHHNYTQDAVYRADIMKNIL